MTSTGISAPDFHLHAFASYKYPKLLVIILIITITINKKRASVIIGILLKLDGAN